jgi:PPM family protein phosphatase
VAGPWRFGKKAVEVSWYSRIWSVIRGVFGAEPSARDLDVTADYPAPSSLTLLPGVLKLRAGVVSTVGNYREHNEDNYFVPGRKSIVDGGSSESTGEMVVSVLEPSNLFIVADGMGGQQAGEEASRMAVEIIPRAVSRRLPNDETDPKTIPAVLRDSVAEANQEILGSSGTVTEYSNMGTTVVLALFRKDNVYVAGIGDSRAYRLRDGHLEQLTKDHSLADALLDAGTITPEELQNHKFKNILYLYLGSKDARGGPEEVRVLDVRHNDRFLLASDGLTGVVGDDEIARVLATCDDPQRAAKVLKDQALSNDSRDNVTCLVIHVVGDTPADGAGTD